jgi:DNA-binding CsgD family transcriptional regulator
MKSNRQQAIHAMLTQSGLIQDLCIPLFANTFIKSFGYIEIFENGKFIHFESDAQIYEKLLSLSSDAKTPINVLNYHDKPGVVITDLHDDDYLPEKLKSIADECHLDHLLVLIEPQVMFKMRSIRFFTFAAVAGKKCVNPMYVNHLDDFKAFSHKIANRMGSFIKTLPQFKQELFSHEVFVRKFEKFFSDDNQQLFKDEASNKAQFQAKDRSSPLSRREQEIVNLYSKGYNSLETANLLHISVRTVHRHFENIRKKLDCNSKQEILLALNEWQ